MLSARIVTAAALIVPLVLAVIYLPSVWVTVFFGVFIAAAAWEWATLIGIKSVAGRVLYTTVLIVLGAALIAAGEAIAGYVLAIGALWWSLVTVELIRHPGVHEGWLHGAKARACAGAMVLLPAWLGIHVLHSTDPNSPRTLFFVFLLVWIADSLAYFAGHFFGRRKLAPLISPGKTIEGVIGGVIGVVCLAWLAGMLLWGYNAARLAVWIGFAVVVALFSVSGDLLESKFKRAAGVKDSGTILPGHGGVLDRIDAVTAAMPVFAFGWHWLFADAL